MLLYVYFLLLLELVLGQKQSFRGGNRYAPVPYYNLGPKPGSGVGVLQDLSNARILSNEPFIISFEFPKLIGSGDSRKNRFGGKSSRTKSQRKKNRKPRQFRHIVLPEEHVLERRKRLEIMRRPPGLEDLRVPQLISDEWRSGKSLLKNENALNPSGRSNYGRIMNLEAKDVETTDKTEKEQPNETVNTLQEVMLPEKGGDEETETDHQKNWENIKKKWISLFAKTKEGGDNEVDENEEKLKIMSRKMWANCQLLKLLKAPQRNPYFYKLLPPNYPALIMDEEKQLQCNQFYDITDLAKDKQMISEKIEQLERILSSGSDPGTRRKREAPEEEVKSEEENTLQDETLQGKLEGEVRSDRSKRTKEKQHIRRQRSKDSTKEKSRRPAKTRGKENRRSKNDKHETTESDDVKRARRKDNGNEIPTKKILEDDNLKPEETMMEKKREKQEIASDSSLQDVFSPSEVSKVIRQKEMEANIFDKVLRAMRKFEDNNPYDESFRPHKRESGNDTESVVPQKNDSAEEGFELEDTIKKLAKIFKILGVKAEAAKKKKACTDCNESEESSSEESAEDGKRLRKSKPGKTPKCTCAECPFCQNCLQCFKECKKAALAAKNALSNNQTPVSLPQTTAGKGLDDDKDLTPTFNINGREGPQEVQATVVERPNNVKLERMYRSKLPPSRDLVRVYFDNPENKLLVWTKRGRRTMPWGPLTSDLQLYRDRARQILKSAEDILHRIRETEDKIHTGQYDENEQGDTSVKTQIMKDMDDIIKKVVNEDETKNMLRTPWEAELEKGVAEGNVVQSNQVSKNFDEATTFNIFKDGIQEKTELPKQSLTSEDSKEQEPGNDGGESAKSYEEGRVELAEPKLDIENTVDEIKSSTEEVESTQREGNTEADGESVEAAVLPIEKIEEEKEVNDKEKSAEHIEDESKEEDEDVPAKVEAINQDKDEGKTVWNIKSKQKAERKAQRKKIIEYMRKKIGKPQNIQQSDESGDEEKDVGDAVDNEKKTGSDESQSVEKKVEGAKMSSGTEETHHGESEEVEREQSRESEEVKKSYNGESEEVERGQSRESEEPKKYSGESEEVKKSYSGETEEVEREQSRESEEPKKYSGESEEVERVQSRESEEVKKSYSGESEEVGRASSRESEEVKNSYEESNVEKAYSGESQSVEGSRDVETDTTQKDNSGESEEVQETYSGESTKPYGGESDSLVKAQGHSHESEEMENSAEKIIGVFRKRIEQGKLQSKKIGADMEKNVENVMKELKDAVKIEKDQDITQSESSDVEKSEYEKDESAEPVSYEDEEQVEGKDTNVEDEVESTKEEPPSTEVEESHPETETEGKSHEEKAPFQDHMKSIEETYIIKGVKQTKEEKEAILKALQKVKKDGDENAEVAEEVVQETEVTEAKKSDEPVENEQDSIKTVIQHLENGHIDENDFHVIKQLDKSQFDHLVGEMHKSDENGMPISYETRMKLCQGVCSCLGNGTQSELSKYEIIKGFLGWLKDLNIEKMAPISA